MATRDMQLIGRLLQEMTSLAGTTRPEQCVRLLHSAQSLSGHLRGIGRDMDSAVSVMLAACQRLSLVKVPVSYRGVCGVRERTAENLAVQTSLQSLTKLISHLPASVFEAKPSERPQGLPEHRRSGRQEPDERNWDSGLRLIDRRTVEVRGAGFRKRFPADHPAVTGAVVNVRSSNVHSFRFALNLKNPKRSMLFARFLQPDQRGGLSTVPGPLYAYADVAPDVFEKLITAGSAGEEIWNSLRVRGTVVGSRFRYTLLQVRQGYVPRRGMLIDGQQWLLSRTRTRRDGRGTVTSALPTRRVGSYRPGSQRPVVTNPGRR